MSGNRTLHREQVSPGKDPLWGLTCTCSISNNKNQWMIWTTGSEGGHTVQGFAVGETSLQDKQDRLEASALRLRHTHTCLDVTASGGSLGGSYLDVVRNYTGEDRNSGDWLLMSLDMSNVVRIWNLSSGPATSKSKNENNDSIITIPAERSFTVENATGTTAVFLPPRLVPNIGSDKNSNYYQDPLIKVVAVAVPCLDGTIALVSTGIPVFNSRLKNPVVDSSKLPPAGTLLETWGSSVSSGTAGGSGQQQQQQEVPLSLAWNAVAPLTLAVASQTGVIHVYSKSIDTGVVRHVRLNHLGSSCPARAVSYTTDGNLLVAGNDQGRLCLWDCSCRSSGNNIQQQQLPPALVHHTTAAHGSWILRLVAIDERRFCTLGADQTISVWNVSQMHHRAAHTFQSNQALWSLSLGPQDDDAAPRLVAGSDSGWIELFSLEANS